MDLWSQVAREIKTQERTGRCGSLAFMAPKVQDFCLKSRPVDNFNCEAKRWLKFGDLFF